MGYKARTIRPKTCHLRDLILELVTFKSSECKN